MAEQLRWIAAVTPVKACALAYCAGVKAKSQADADALL